jgi:hypothetical protein
MMIFLGAVLLMLCLIGLLTSTAWLIVGTATLFVYKFHAGWLFVLGVLVDGYFGTFTQVPMYSLVFGGFALVVEVLKLRLIGVESNHG